MISKAERVNQAHQLGLRLLLAIEFLEQVQHFPSGPSLREIVRTQMARGRLSAIRILERDVNEMLLTLTPGERERLEDTLLQRLAVDSDPAWLAEEAAARQCLAAGRVRSEKERLRIERYLEALAVRGGSSDEIAALEALLKGT